MKRDIWLDDNVQFARLLAEINYTVGLTDDNLNDLRDSMNLTRNQLAELIERAEKRWQEIKDRVCPAPGRRRRGKAQALWIPPIGKAVERSCGCRIRRTSRYVGTFTPCVGHE